MRRRLDVILALLTICLALPVLRVDAGAPLEIVLTGSVATPAFGITDLAGGPGTDFTYASIPWESATNAVLVEVKGGNPPWSITVRKLDSASWNTNLKVEVKRNAGGTGPGVLSGGTSYFEIKNTDLPFFSGTGNKKSVPIQYRISGISVILGAGTFTTTIIYTVTDT